MFATLGTIQFEVLGGPDAYTSEGKSRFAASDVLASKPRLQWVGDDAQQINWTIRWDVSFCNPAVQLANLRAVQAQHLALALIFGVGTVAGTFVIESIKVKATQMSGFGGMLSCTVDLALKEWTPDPSAAVPAPGPLLGIVGPAPTGPAKTAPGATALAAVPSLPSNALQAVFLAPDDVPLAMVVRAPAAFVAPPPPVIVADALTYAPGGSNSSGTPMAAPGQGGSANPAAVRAARGVRA